MIELTGLSKRYDGQGGVGPLDLALPAARTTALLGPSGCGKSTLLRLVMGLLVPDAGQVLVDGRPVTADSAPDLRRRMGYVIQEGGLFPHLTAAGNAALMACHLGWAEPRVGARVGALADLLRLPRELLERYPVELSGGQRQRVALLRALMLDPEVLLLDEPLGALDPMIRAGLQEELGELFRTLGKTVVLVTHDVAEASQLADTVVLLRDGLPVQVGPFDDLVARPADPFVEAFLGAQRGWSA